MGWELVCDEQGDLVEGPFFSCLGCWVSSFELCGCDESSAVVG